VVGNQIDWGYMLGIEKEASILPKIIIYIICLSSFFLIFIGLFLFENSVIRMLTHNDPGNAFSGLTFGIIAITIGPLLILAGYPILIYLFNRKEN
jgi:hypothetical protein